MNKIFLVIIMGFFCLHAKAQQTGQILLNPYHPEFGQQESNTTILDANLTNELVKFSERRDRVQEAVMLDHTPYDPQLIQSNSFVLKRVMDRSLNRFMKSDYFKKTSLGRASETVKQKMETDVTFKDEKNVEHKFDFRIAAFQGQAFIQYSGFTTTQLRYDIHDGGNTALIFQQNLDKNSTIGIETTIAGPSRAQLLVLNLIW